MRNTIKRVLVILSIVSLFATSGFAGGDQAGGMHAVTDHAGRTVMVPDKIERVVVANMPPLTPVYCQFMGAENHLVGMPANSIADTSIARKVVPNFDNIQTGFYARGEINVEELAKLEPDIVFATTYPEHIDVLEKAGFTVVAFDVQKGGIDSLATVGAWYELLGEVFGMQSQAAAVNEYNVSMAATIAARIAQVQEEEKPGVLYLPWFNGQEGSLWTSPSGFAGQFYAETTGARNLGAEVSPDASLSIEEVAAMNPDRIYLGSFDGTVSAAEFYANDIVQQFWGELGAVKNQAVVRLPGGFCNWFQPTADSALSVLWQAKMQHPALFEDIDMARTVKEYYAQYYGVELTDEEVASMIGA